MSIFQPNIPQQEEKKSLGNINAAQVNSNQQTVPVKYLAGRRILAGDYITPAYNQKAVPIKTKAGKGDSQTTGYTYYADFALMFCMGGRHPVDAIHTVIVESEIVWQGTVTRGAGAFEDIVVSSYGSLRIYWGTATQTVDPTLAPRGAVTGGIDPRDRDTWPNNTATGGQTTDNGEASGDSNPLSGHYDDNPAYLNQCYGVFTDWKIGDNRTSIPNIQVELKRGVPFIGATQLTSDDRGVNIVGVIYDILTDPLTGAGLPDALLLSASWTTTKTDFDNFRISPLITSQQDLRSVVGKLLDSADLFLRRNGTLLEIGSWTHGNINPATLPQIFDDDLAESPTLKPANFNDTINRAVVTYKDRNHYYNDASQIALDANNRRIVGVPRIAYLALDHLTDPTLAAQFAAEYRTIYSQPSQPGTLPLKRERVSALGLLPGMRVRWNSTKYSLQIVCRLQDYERADDRTTSIAFNMEAERGLWPNHWTPAPVPGDGDFHIGPAAIVRARIFELPDPLKPINETEVQVLALAQRRTTDIVGFRTHVSADGGSTYDLAEDRNNFSAFGRVDATFNPATISGCQLWLRADTLAVADGAPVSSWNDDSGNGRNATQATAAKKPIRHVNDIFFRGMPGVEFDGVDDYLRTANGGFNGAHTIFTVTAVGQNQTGHIISWGNYATGKVRSVMIWDIGSGTWRIYYFDFGEQISSGVGPSGLNVMAHVVDGSNNLNSFWYDTLGASASLPGMINHSGNTPFTIGADPQTTPTQFANVHVAEIIVYDGALSTANRTKVIDYLQCKYRLGAMVRLYGVDSDSVVSQTPQARSNFTLLGFLEDDPVRTDTEIVSVGTVFARGDGLFKITYVGACYGSSIMGHAPDSNCWFIFRRNIVAVANENFIPGSLRSFKLQPFTSLQEYDLASVTPFNYLFLETAPVPTAALAPSSQTFITSLALSVVIPTGYTVRYTTDDTAVRSNSRPWPGGGVTITQTCVVRVRCYHSISGRGGDETRCFYTELAGGSTVIQTCGAVSASYTGAKGRTAGNLILDCATSGATLHASKNGAAATTHATPWTIALIVGDTVEYWASHASMSDSGHGYFDNERTTTDQGGGGGGGGTGGGGGHHLEP